jgi:hypothetical protein
MSNEWGERLKRSFSGWTSRCDTPLLYPYLHEREEDRVHLDGISCHLNTRHMASIDIDTGSSLAIVVDGGGRSGVRR